MHHPTGRSTLPTPLSGYRGSPRSTDRPMSTRNEGRTHLKGIAEEHPELFHYTSAGGLEGILKTQTLWATNALFLNDRWEITAFEMLLPELLGPAIDAGV